MKFYKAALAQGSSHHAAGDFHAHQALFGFRLGAAGANNLDDLIDVGQREQQSFDGVLPLAGTTEQELRPTTNNFDAVSHELLKHLLDIQLSRLTIDEGQED